MRTRKEACWALSNIAGGTAAQALLLADVLLPVVLLLADSGESETVKKEAEWVLQNIAKHGAGPLKPAVESGGIIPALLDLCGESAAAAGLLAVIVQHSGSWAALVEVAATRKELGLPPGPAPTAEELAAAEATLAWRETLLRSSQVVEVATGRAGRVVLPDHKHSRVKVAYADTAEQSGWLRMDGLRPPTAEEAAATDAACDAVRFQPRLQPRLCNVPSAVDRS